MTKVVVVILAGGNGSRCDINLPKQFHKLDDDITILDQSIMNFQNIRIDYEANMHQDNHAKIHIPSNIASENFMLDKNPQKHQYSHQTLIHEYSKDAQSPHDINRAECNHFNMPIIIVSNTDINTDIVGYDTVQGGTNRQQSSYNGVLSAMQYNPEAIIIHDGCRPFVTKSLIDGLINNLFNSADYECHACVPILQISDLVTDKKIYYDNQYIVQTPQIFRADKILYAHEQAAKNNMNFRDESSMYRTIIGDNIKYIDGDIFNIKITYNKDLQYARYIQHIHRSRI